MAHQHENHLDVEKPAFDSNSQVDDTKSVQRQFTSDLENRDAHSYNALPASLKARIDFRLIPVLAFMYGSTSPSRSSR